MRKKNLTIATLALVSVLSFLLGLLLLVKDADAGDLGDPCHRHVRRDGTKTYQYQRCREARFFDDLDARRRHYRKGSRNGEERPRYQSRVVARDRATE